MRPVTDPLPTDTGDPEIAERPDGYYWTDRRSGRSRGPFASIAEARADHLGTEESGVEDSDFEPGETLREAEDEIGIADWIDPETGAPAEAYRPHLEDH